MNNDSIYFDNFINKFYSNTSNTKMILQVDIENSQNSDTNIYDIHHMLLDLLIKGIERLYCSVCNDSNKPENNITMGQFFSDQNIIDKTITTLQHFFSNINIKINIKNLSKEKLIDESFHYLNRRFRIDINSIQKLIFNGSHQMVDNLEEINSFLLIDDINNLCISFSHI